MASHFYWLLIGVLVVWRLTHLLYGEDGPWNLLARLRYLAGQGFWGSLMDCFYCLSLWIALPFAIVLGERWVERMLLWLGFSAGAILLERATPPREPTPWPLYSEGKEAQHELLRQKEGEPDHTIEPKA